MNEKLHQPTTSITRLSKERLENEFRKIYDSYAKLLFYISYRIVNNVLDAEDAVNEAFLKFFNNYYDVKNQKYFLVTTVRNLSINIYNQKKKQNSMSIEGENLVISDNSSLNGVNQLIDDFRLFLDEEEIGILLDHIIYCMTFSEIAKNKRKTKHSIASKYRRILDKIKKNYIGVEKNEK